MKEGFAGYGLQDCQGPNCKWGEVTTPKVLGVLCDPLLGCSRMDSPSSAPVLQQEGDGSRKIWGETIENWIDEKFLCLIQDSPFSQRQRVSIQASVSQNQGGKA